MTSTTGEMWDMHDRVEDNTASRFEPLYTYADVAKLCRVSQQTVMEWVKRGIVASPLYIGYSARFNHAQVKAILEGRDEPGTHPVTDSPRAKLGRAATRSPKHPGYKAPKRSVAPRPSSTKHSKPKARPIQAVKKPKPKHD